MTTLYSFREMKIQLVKELPLLAEKGAKRCVLCAKKDDNELLFGQFYTNGKLSAHYFCLLFASGLFQRPTDDVGIMGFPISDIKKEVKRGRQLKCFKCHKRGATLGCCDKKCKRSYHFSCGSESQMINQYFGACDSYCINHHPLQKVPEVRDHQATCSICLDVLLIDKPSYDVLWAPCCKNQGWFHRDCMQKLALSAGYFFKCPLCSDDGLFFNEMKDMGIYVPNQEASWELEFEQSKKCEHPTCICPTSRTHNDNHYGK